jgi:type IV secretion system protein VirB10
MADGIPSPAGGDMHDPPRQGPAEPPPLDAIRVKGPGAKGLNKPAILATAGGGIAIVLLLASGALSSAPSRKPADARPMMSDPARPEIAQGAVRTLPADYTQAAARHATAPAAAPPELGPPLPGDVAAFATSVTNARQPGSPSGDWSGPSASPGPTSYGANSPTDPALAEVQQAKRSGLFFALREAPAHAAAPLAQQAPAVQPPPDASLNATAVQAPDKPMTGRTKERVLFPGAVISASLVTELNSESPGPVIAQVTQTIYDSATGRMALIPQGARLIGDYKSSTRYGQSRIAILWSRLVMPDGDEIRLDEAAASPSGVADVAGKVDNHWGEVFGAAALGTLISIGVATTEEPQLTYGGIGAQTRDPVDAALAEGVQQGASSMTSRIVDRGLAIPPTIRVEAGKRIAVIVTRRIAL